MGFLAPWFLGGLAALGVPVFVHLLRKHVTIPRRVSSLMFFERGTQSSTRHRRVWGLLLFSPPACFFLVLGVGVLGPLLRGAPAGGEWGFVLCVLVRFLYLRSGEPIAGAIAH